MLRYNNKKVIFPQELDDYVILVFRFSAKKQRSYAGDMEIDTSMS